MKINSQNPTQCHLMSLQSPALEELKKLKSIKVLMEESHHERAIFKCPECGQLYFYEWYEEIDWDEGDDPQYATWIPIPDEKAADNLNDKSPMELLAFSPQIRMDDSNKIPTWYS